MTTLGRIHSLKQFPAIMRRGCRIALTGTPGTGKTTISDILSMEGFKVLSLEKLAEKFNCLGELDYSDNSKPVDMELLNTKLEQPPPIINQVQMKPAVLVSFLLIHMTLSRGPSGKWKLSPFMRLCLVIICN